MLVYQECFKFELYHLRTTYATYTMLRVWQSH